MDHPYIRKSDLCPLCDGLKGVGMIACWPCYRGADLRNGNATAEAIFDRRERSLKDEAHESKELIDPAEINAMVDPTGALQRAGLYNPLPE